MPLSQASNDRQSKPGFWDRLEFAFAYNRVLSMLSRKDFGGAAKLFSSKPKFSYFIRWELLKLNTLRETGELRAALDMSTAVVARIERSKIFSASEKKYLQAYVKWLHDSCLYRLLPKDDQHDLFKIDWDSVNLSDVGQSIKLDFPLRAHPLWTERGISKM